MGVLPVFFHVIQNRIDGNRHVGVQQNCVHPSLVCVQQGMIAVLTSV